MPVTAKLSKLFYERLGDQITNELAEWLNQVDQSYRSDLRELNELNFARFDAKLEQRIAETNARIDRRLTEHDRWLVGIFVTTLLGFAGLGLGLVGLWLRH